MTGVVFDRPVVAAVANELIREYGLQKRVSAKEGDYLVDDIGTGYDLIWACATLNFARHDLDTLIGKVHDALNSGGVFIAFQDGMTHERTQPDTMLGHLGDALRSVQIKFIRDFNATLENGRLVYEFLIPCHVTATDAYKKVSVSTYDPSYYTAIFFAKNNPVSLTAADAFELKTAIREDPRTKIYFDMIHPWTLFMEFRKKA